MRLLTTTYACDWWAQAREMPYLLPLPMIAELTGAPQKPSGIRPQRNGEPREALIPKWELTPEVRGSSKKHCTRGSAIVAMSTSSQWTTQPPPPPPEPDKNSAASAQCFRSPKKEKRGKFSKSFSKDSSQILLCKFYHICFTKLCRILEQLSPLASSLSLFLALFLALSLSLSQEKGSS